MKDLMLDLETLGTTNNAVITQIGACFFNRYTGEIIKEFEINLNVNDGLSYGMVIDYGSLKFWMEHKETASWLSNPVPLTKGLEAFRKFYTLEGEGYVWCHSTFDAVILNNAYDKIKQGHPYSYKNVRDIRTLVDLSGITVIKESKDPKTHKALEDCRYQVKYCAECFRKLKTN